MKTPLMNNNGIRTKFSGIITCPGPWPGIEANIIPIAAKPKAERTRPAVKAIKSVTIDWKNMTPTIMGIIDTPAP